MTRALAVVLLLSCVPRVALADDAQQLLRQAEAKRREGDIAGALAIYRAGAARILAVDEDEIAAAARLYFTAIHNVAEGAGAAALAGLLQERARVAGRRVGLILSGGNIDAGAFATILEGRTPGV